MDVWWADQMAGIDPVTMLLIWDWGFVFLGVVVFVISLRNFLILRLQFAVYMMVAALFGSLTGLGMLALYSSNSFFVHLGTQTAYFCMGIVMGAILLHTETLEHPNPSLPSLVLVTINCGLLVTAMTLGKWESVEIIPGFPAILGSGLGMLVIFALGALFVAYVLYRIVSFLLRCRTIIQTVTERVLLWLIILASGMIIPLLGGTLFFSAIVFPDVGDPTLRMSIGHIIVLGSFTIAIAALVFLRGTLFVLASKIQALIVMSHTGIPLISHEFPRTGTSAPFTIDETILTGILTMFSKFFHEVGGADSGIQEISFGDRYYFFDYLPERPKLDIKSYGCVVIAEVNSKYIRDALGRFLREFDRTYRDIISNFVGAHADFADAGQLIQKVFHLSSRRKAKKENLSKIIGRGDE